MCDRVSAGFSPIWINEIDEISFNYMVNVLCNCKAQWIHFFVMGNIFIFNFC